MRLRIIGSPHEVVQGDVEVVSKGDKDYFLLYHSFPIIPHNDLSKGASTMKITIDCTPEELATFMQEANRPKEVRFGVSTGDIASRLNLASRNSNNLINENDEIGQLVGAPSGIMRDIIKDNVPVVVG